MMSEIMFKVIEERGRAGGWSILLDSTIVQPVQPSSQRSHMKEWAGGEGDQVNVN